MTIRQRNAGVLLHPTSFPGPEGIGTLGSSAVSFIDFLAEARFSLWQVLPLTPPAAGNSPYSAYSAFAGNPLLIDLEQLVMDNFLSKPAINDLPVDSVDFDRVAAVKGNLLRMASKAFFESAKPSLMEEFWDFCNRSCWLHDYALFQSLKQHFNGRPWTSWPSDILKRDTESIERASKELGTEIGSNKFEQWLFFRQWNSLRSYATEKGIGIIGDLPIFVAHDSADVWCNQELFLLDSAGMPTSVAGVPPDYFSETGQLWGNPLYDWDKMSIQGYSWWISRIRQLLEQFDQVRIDHFRGFEAAWHVPAAEKTAVNGCWVPGPGDAFFNSVEKAIGKLPFIAEDLGVITAEVEALRDAYSFPGMKILQFAFDSDASNPYLPHNHTHNSFVYTGTHDNDTTAGWYETLGNPSRERISSYLGCSLSDPVGGLIRAAMMSVADTVIIPLQDLLRLPSDARMNIPGTAYGNWSWRYRGDALYDGLASGLASVINCYGRSRTS